MSLNNTLDEMDLTDIYRAFHSKEAKYTFSSSVHGTFSKIDHMIGHKASLKKFKKIEIISSFFSDHKGLKLENNPKGKNSKLSKLWRLNSMTLNNEWVKNEIREEIKNFLETNFPSKRTGKKSRGSNTHIRQNRLPKKGHKERPRSSLHNTQRKNPPRRHKHCKYLSLIHI